MKKQEREMTTIAVDRDTLEQFNAIKNKLQLVNERSLTGMEVLRFLIDGMDKDVDRMVREYLDRNKS